MRIPTDAQCASHDRADLVSSTIHPGLEDAHEVLSEVFDEMEGQLVKEIERIRELMRIRHEDPGGYSPSPITRSKPYCKYYSTKAYDCRYILPGRPRTGLGRCGRGYKRYDGRDQLYAVHCRADDSHDTVHTYDRVRPPLSHFTVLPLLGKLPWHSSNSH